MQNDAHKTTGDGVWKERFYDLVEFVKSYAWFDERMDFYQSLAFKLRELSGADSVNIRLLTPAQDSFVLYAHHGDVEEVANRQYGVLSASAGRMPHLIATGEPIVFDFANPSSEDVKWERGVDDGFSCAVIVALPGVQGIVGTADFLFHAPREWSDSDIDWLRSLGEFVGATIGNALLTDNMLSLRVSDERRSLASEIHDSIVQSASVISMEAESALDSLSHKDYDSLSHNLDLISRAASELDLSMRGELANLNVGVKTDEESSLEQLERMVASFCREWGLAFEFAGNEQPHDIILPKRIMVQLTRVVNEALVNVVRHARATEVKVAYVATDASLTISVEDDGHGFKPDDVGPSHLGLRIMRERLASIDSTLGIASAPGAGTRVDITVPYLV